MEDKNKLQSLFDIAQKDLSGPSYEEVANRFEASVGSIAFFSSLSKWLSNYPSLKYIAMISTFSALAMVLYIVLPTPTHNLNENIYPRQEDISEVSFLPSAKPELLPLEDKKVITVPLNLPNLATDGNTLSTDSITKVASRSEENAIVIPFDKLPTPGLDLLIFDNPLLQPPFSTPKQTARDTLIFGQTITTDTKKWSTQSKKYEKTYPLSPNGTTIISNEFGLIDIKTWDKDSVKINAEIKVEGHKAEKILEVLENLNIVFTPNSNTLKARLNVKQKKAISWHYRKNWRVQINYKVLVPQSSNLDLTHVKGDIHVGRLKGKAAVQLNWGELKADYLGDDSIIKLSNAEAYIQESGKLSCNLHFSDIIASKTGDFLLKSNNSNIEIQNSQNISGTSTYSQLNFGKIGNYEVSGNGNKITAQTAKNLSIDGSNATVDIDSALYLTAKNSFSKIRIGSLKGAELSLNNSELDVPRIQKVTGKTDWSILRFGDMKTYRLNTKGTKVTINKVDSLISKGYDSKLDITEISGPVDLDFKFGYCNSKITSPKPSLVLIGQNANFFFTLPKSATFNLDLKSNTKNYQLPDQLNIVFQQELISKHAIQGSIGQENEVNQIKAELNFGKLDILLKK